MKTKTLYNLVEQITPPFILSSIKKTFFYKYLKSRFWRSEYTPEWHTIKSGRLKGANFFVDTSGAWQKEMIQGTYDSQFSDYLDELDLRDKTIFDIGSHVGYHSLMFADYVGEKGKVYAFEPNTFNKKRIEKNLKVNPLLASRIEVLDVAVSDKFGTEDFIFTDKIEEGTSSGSFLASSDTFFDKKSYEKDMGFQRTSMKTVPLDDYEKLGIDTPPSLLKIDVEGAEYLVLKGAEKLLRNVKPIILIEVHSIPNMYKVMKFLEKSNYDVNLLKKEDDGRCFLVAHPKIDV